MARSCRSPRGQNHVHFLGYSGREMLAVRLSQFDPTATAASIPCCSSEADFCSLSKHSFEPVRCCLLSQGAGMRRRKFLRLVGGAASWPVVALAQQPEPMRRIGVLVGLAENDPEMKERLAGFRQGLEKLGWSEGSNVRIDYRFAPAWHSGALACKRTCRVAARCDPRTVNTRDRCLETRDQYDPYRFRWRRRPNWIGPTGQNFIGLGCGIGAACLCGPVVVQKDRTMHPCRPAARPERLCDPAVVIFRSAEANDRIGTCNAAHHPSQHRPL